MFMFLPCTLFQISKAKLVNGEVVTGPELAQLLVRMVDALNDKDLPSAGGIIESFNKEVRHSSVFDFRLYYIWWVESPPASVLR